MFEVFFVDNRGKFSNNRFRIFFFVGFGFQSEAKTLVEYIYFKRMLICGIIKDKSFFEFGKIYHNSIFFNTKGKK